MESGHRTQRCNIQIVTWIFLALLGPFFWAGSNIFDKYALEKVSKGVYDFLFFGSIGSTFIFILTLSVFGVEYVFPYSLYAIGSGFLLNVSYLFYSYALEKEDASHVVPLYISYAVFVLIFNVVLFGETLSSTQYLSFAVIFCGALFLSIESFDFSSIKYRTGAVRMIPAILFIAVSITLFAQSLKGLTFHSSFILDMGGFALSGAALLVVPNWRTEIVRGIRDATLRKFTLFLFNDALDLTGHLAYKYALLLAPAASLVAAVNGIQPFYVLLVGLLFTVFFPSIIKEDISIRTMLQKIVGAVVIGVGIALLELG